MIHHYIVAVSYALNLVWGQLNSWSVPLSITAGFLALAGAIALASGRKRMTINQLDWRRIARYVVGYALVVVISVVGWQVLATARSLVQQDEYWRQKVDATQNPVPDAAPVMQSGPSVAALVQHTYTRTLTLPPTFLTRLGTEGVQALAPYLSEPSSQNVVKLRDRFRRSGRSVVFTRDSTIETEAPIAFADTQIKVSFQRLAERAYDAAFEGHYTFANSEKVARPVHFRFTLPEAGTIRDFKISMDGQDLREKTQTNPDEDASEDSDANVYQWRGTLAPGESRTALVSYHVVGARVWNYNIGSERRRVQRFRLDAFPSGGVRFVRGSLQPTSQSGNALRENRLQWQLADIVTAQTASLVFPASQDTGLYLQALSALPVAYVLFLVGVLACAAWWGEFPEPARAGVGLVGFGFGLMASTVFTIYVGSFAGLILGPLGGAALAAWALGRRYLWPSVPLALLPATFLSAQNSGLLIVVLSLITLTLLLFVNRNHKARRVQTNP